MPLTPDHKPVTCLLMAVVPAVASAGGIGHFLMRASLLGHDSRAFLRPAGLDLWELDVRTGLQPGSPRPAHVESAARSERAVYSWLSAISSGAQASAAALGEGVGAAVFCGGNRSDEENPARCGLASAPELGIMSPLAELTSQEVSSLAQVKPMTMCWTLLGLRIAGSTPDIICRSYVRCTGHECIAVRLLAPCGCSSVSTRLSWLTVLLQLLQALGLPEWGHAEVSHMRPSWTAVQRPTHKLAKLVRTLSNGRISLAAA